MAKASGILRQIVLLLASIVSILMYLAVSWAKV
jgi:hypothetical protein